MERGAGEGGAWFKEYGVWSGEVAFWGGDIQMLETEPLLGFTRFANRAEDPVVLLFNPSPSPTREKIAVPDARLMGWSAFREGLSGARAIFVNGLIDVGVTAETVELLSPTG